MSVVTEVMVIVVVFGHAQTLAAGAIAGHFFPEIWKVSDH